eukprot:3657670-Rhodomonas_salina.1
MATTSREVTVRSCSARTVTSPFRLLPSVAYNQRTRRFATGIRSSTSSSTNLNSRSRQVCDGLQQTQSDTRVGVVTSG